MNRRYALAALGAAGLIAVVGAVSLSSGRTASTDAPSLRQARLTEAATATIPVEGMVCLSCAATIKHRLSSMDGVLSAEVSLADQQVKIRYAGDPTTPAKAAATINSLGYKAGTPVT